MIRVTNLNKKYDLNERTVKSIISKILKLIKKPVAAELEVVFLNDNKMRSLNKRYRNKDRATDVLSFKIDKREFKPGVFLGEVFISLDTALKNSRIFKTSFAEEITLYIIHGLLHLAGYDDETPKDKQKMSKKEGDILNRLCARLNLSKALMPR